MRWQSITPGASIHCSSPCAQLSRVRHRKWACSATGNDRSSRDRNRQVRAGVGGLLLCAALTGQIVAAQDHPLLDERGWYLMRDRVGLAPARATALCNNPTSTVDAARARATLAATAAERAPQVAAAWRELTCARVALWAADARATESYLMPLGTSWAVGAYRALERWLAVAPEDSLALNLLAAVIVDLGHRPKEV